ncbi:hypothetical protein AHF37_10213 [Paragonimus kellicotti]|nr:hypothetical protein AHF37_10213 [Paragonimus kellicotti]
MSAIYEKPPASSEVPTESMTPSENLSDLDASYRQNQRQAGSQQAIMNPRRSIVQNEVISLSGVPGAAFNTTPIYDAQGSLVGLQTPAENSTMAEGIPTEHNENTGYLAVPPVYQYNTVSQPGCNFSGMTYNPYSNYALNPTSPYSSQPQPQQFHYQSRFVNRDLPQKTLLTNSENRDELETTVVRGMPKFEQSFDTCPTVCSLFAVFFCPITLWCSLPALVYSLCAYTDHRMSDMERSQQKSDMARHLVITACVIGLLLCITWAILAFFYYEVIIATVNDVLRILQHRLSSGT